jgi:hypothetical protein
MTTPYKSTDPPLSSRVVGWTCGPPKEMKKASVRQLLFIEPLPLPLSSRAQPRDLQFRGPLLEMFFDGAKPRDLRCALPRDHTLQKQP